MSRSNIGSEKKLGAGRVVAVAIENNKTSQHAAKWAVENLLPKDQCLYLIHVKLRTSNASVPSGNYGDGNETVIDGESKDLFDSFRVFCNRKNIQCKEVLLEEMDISKALTECISSHAIELLVLGASTRGGIVRFRTTDVPTSVSKSAPPFCTVYIISKGKISSVRSATAPVPKSAAPSPSPSPPHAGSYQLPQQQHSNPLMPTRSPDRFSDPQITRNYPPRPTSERHAAYGGFRQQGLDDEQEMISPFNRRGHKAYESSIPDSDISFVSSGRPSIDRIFPSLYNVDDLDNSSSGIPSRLSFGSDFDAKSSFASSFSGGGGQKSIDLSSPLDNYSFSSQGSANASSSLRLSDASDEVEAEMRRLKLELKQTMEMYSSACKEALTAKQKAIELQRWKSEEEKKLEEAREGEGAAMAMVEMEQEKCKAALKAAEASQRIAVLEAQKRMNVERKSEIEANQRKKSEDSFHSHGTTARYRRYSIEEIEDATKRFSDTLKIGEGGYGPVFKCELDHTQVAIKVLKSDAAQGRAQFNQEVEVLSCIRHPNMVLLLGACPEFGCIVYEYMANGSLDDCLFRRGKSPPLPWQLRFQIAAEIATGLLFLHQAKPEPIVHRDLKPGNILLDRNYVSKIGDVGLARLVPPSVQDTVTQYRMTSTAGTFCYIDPEYQQTGMLGIKSDIYSLGIMLLQLVTAKPPMGLTHHVGRSIEKGTFAEMLDPAVQDWPIEHALHFAKLSLQCAEMRRKDRPDLGKVVLPELNKLRIFADENMPMMMYRGGGAAFNPRGSGNYFINSTASSNQDNMSESNSLSGTSGGYESRSSTSSLGRL
ncbi:U-box domain-containing protein 52-like isoform X2 [Cicer arietinum]|uniref:RING-type E3 ubiquitin transferase n=1 Tax=Cicer arietinum TaxID=3827 RepID=A0A1S2Z146_CICAR|nr:U-box domain-containing protein 52-like isoform X2 [Cicer arietinum]